MSRVCLLAARLTGSILNYLYYRAATASGTIATYWYSEECSEATPIMRTAPCETNTQPLSFQFKFSVCVFLLSNTSLSWQMAGGTANKRPFRTDDWMRAPRGDVTLIDSPAETSFLPTCPMCVPSLSWQKCAVFSRTKWIDDTKKKGGFPHLCRRCGPPPRASSSQSIQLRCR